MWQEVGRVHVEPVSLASQAVTCAPPTLQRLGPVLPDHDAELQDQLRCRFQESLQQPQHVDVRVLEHHGPVPAPLVLLLPARHDAQVQRPDVPAVETEVRKLINNNTIHFYPPRHFFKSNLFSFSLILSNFCFNKFTDTTTNAAPTKIIIRHS